MTIYIKSEENGWEVERQIELPNDEKLVKSILRSVKRRATSPETAGGVLSRSASRKRPRQSAQTWRWTI